MKRNKNKLAFSVALAIFIGIGFWLVDSPNQRPFMIKHGWDIPSATFVADNSTYMDSFPFDGVIIRMDNGLSTKVQTQSPINYHQFKSSLDPLKRINLENLKHNFLIVYSTPSGDLFDDWSTPLKNFSHMARAAKEAGLEGIFFDNEEYFGDAVDFPENCQGGKTISQCRDQAYLRGREVMEAIISGWPDVKLIATIGPYLSEGKTANYFNDRGIYWNDVAWANQLRGSFIIGMASATRGTPAQFIDGGEIYSAKTKENFEDIKYWQTKGIAHQGDLIPEDLRASWPNIVSSSFGVYDKAQMSEGVYIDAVSWKTTLMNALEVADDYVWAYTERYNWWDTEKTEEAVPTEWVILTRQALNS